MQQQKNKIYLADDHILMRDSLADYIHGLDNCEVIGKGANGHDVVKDFSAGIVSDILLLDLSMPDMDGYETAEWVKKHHPSVKIIIVTMYSSEMLLIRLLEAGVRGIVKKDIRPADLRTALEDVSRNKHYYCSSSTRHLAELFHRDENNKNAFDKPVLSEQEKTLLRLSATEMTFPAIASEMNLTIGRINNMKSSLFEKLDIVSRTGMIIYAVKEGLVKTT